MLLRACAAIYGGRASVLQACWLARTAHSSITISVLPAVKFTSCFSSFFFWLRFWHLYVMCGMSLQVCVCVHDNMDLLPNLLQDLWDTCTCHLPSPFLLECTDLKKDPEVNQWVFLFCGYWFYQYWQHMEYWSYICFFWGGLNSSLFFFVPPTATLTAVKREAYCNALPATSTCPIVCRSFFLTFCNCGLFLFL